MRFHSLTFNLEAEIGEIHLLRRGSDELVYNTPYSQTSDSICLEVQLPNLNYEARRLIAQWAFDVCQVNSLILPNPISTDVLKDWALQGARYGSEGVVLAKQDFDRENIALGCKGQAWIERDLPLVQVACLLLINEHNEVLLTQRPPDKSHAGLWEFPGGKLEPGESPELAICREIREEIGITIWNSCLAPLTFASHAYGEFHLTMFAYVCYRWTGDPVGLEGQTLKWEKVKAIDANLMPPANIPLVNAIRDLLE